MLSLVKAGFGHNFFNMNQPCLLSATGCEISGSAGEWSRLYDLDDMVIIAQQRLGLVIRANNVRKKFFGAGVALLMCRR